MYELIIAEKPSAARKIAAALANGKAIKETYQKSVPYYVLTHGNTDIIVASAVGHLYGLAEKVKTKGFAYPIFKIQWIPSSEISKSAQFTEKYLKALKKLAKDAKEIIIATDYDVEGEVIGLNVLKYACKRKDAKRMKFSTLTKPDLIKSYETAAPTINWPQAEAGETRHFLDYFYGINLSRALTSAIKKAGRFKILSTGRVQGPALKIIVEKEKSIQEFKPVAFWQIELQGKTKGNEIIAWHKEDKFWEKEKAEDVIQKTKDEKKGRVTKVEAKQFKQTPPHPFDLTTLQTESYRVFGISPKQTLAIAQDLYSNGYLSYPRTSSQKLPASLKLKDVIEKLKNKAEYLEICKKVLAGKLIPNEGKKEDPAHPAIYPTGQLPKEFADPRFNKIYDLVAKRFLACFGEFAVRETVKITLDVNSELFRLKGTRTVEKGWHVLYAPYVKLEEIELPALNEGDLIDILQILMHDKETQPPKRYTQASLIKEMEKRGLGTKATRANILDTLYERLYIKGKAIEATELGLKIINVLQENCPKIIEEELTRHFEEDMNQIRNGTKHQKEILVEAKKSIIKILDDFREKEEIIGEGLKDTFVETKIVMTTVGPCLKCEKGILGIRKGKFGKFIACDGYPECETTFKLPSNGLIEITDKNCEKCKHPIVQIIKKGKRPQLVCINPECPDKDVKTDRIDAECPKCSKGKLVLRKSVYGGFLACGRFPKCFYTERIKAEGDDVARVNAKFKAGKKKTAKKKKAKKKKSKKKKMKKTKVKK